MNPATALEQRRRRWLGLYNLAFPPLFLAMLPGAIYRLIRRGQFRQGFGMRFGRPTPALREWCAQHRPLWISSVSVGETRLAFRMLDALRKANAQLPMLLTTTTTTAAALVRERAERDPWLQFAYNPLDFPPTLDPALHAIQPRGLLAIEAFWPNLFHRVNQRDLPVFWLPRISPRSRRRYEKLGEGPGALFAMADRITVGFETERKWLRKVGVPDARIAVVGSVKFDHVVARIEARPDFRAFLQRLGWDLEHDTVVIGGSTFPGEERLLADTCRTAFADRDWRLIVVPRHVERRAEIGRELASGGHRYTLRTATEPAANPILLVDTTGELADWYACAEIAVVGKSLLAKGGQNPVEPCLAGCRVIAGPDMSNFHDITQDLLGAGLIEQIEGPERLGAVLGAHRSDGDPCRIQQRTQEVLAPHLGSAERVAAMMMEAVARKESGV